VTTHITAPPPRPSFEQNPSFSLKGAEELYWKLQARGFYLKPSDDNERIKVGKNIEGIALTPAECDAIVQNKPALLLFLLQRQRPFEVWYPLYLQSPAWREKRQQVLERDSFTCQTCGARNVPLQVHHKTYDRVFNESLYDLISLCEPCHQQADRWRKMSNSSRGRRYWRKYR
jgi:hypothetical protein